MESIRGIPTPLTQSGLTDDTSVNQIPQHVQVFIEGEPCQFSIGSNENRQQIKAMFEQLSFVTPAEDGQPRFGTATGEQKAAVKILNPAWFLN